MCSAPMNRIFHSLGFRLLAGSLAGFLVALLAAWLLAGQLLTRYLMNRVDRDLETEVLDVSVFLDRFGAGSSADRYTDELERFGYTRGIDRAFYRVFDLDGNLMAQSDLAFWEQLPDTLPQAGSDFFTWQTFAAASREARVVWFRNPDGYLLQIGLDLAETRRLQSWTSRLFGGMLLFVAVFGSALGVVAMSKPLRGIGSVAEVAGHISGEMDFERRVQHPTGSAETDQLALAFNAMLAKIQLLVGSMREIMDNIAHDVRSPVARMRAAAERALDGGNQEDLAGRIVEDCDNILHLTNLLLEISVTEAGLASWQPESLDLAELVEDAADMFEPLFEAGDLHSEVAVSHRPCPILADRKVLQRVVANLLDNAVKYTPPGQKIRLVLESAHGDFVLAITNTGVSIPEDLCDKIFDRFYRLDTSRTRPGSGLGLSYCKAAIAAMGGEIECVSGQNRCTFRIRLPSPSHQ